jgi:hypothetical protein
MTSVAWILAVVGAVVAFALAAGSAAGVFPRIDFYAALGVTPLPALAIYLSVPQLLATVRAGAQPQDLLVPGGPFLIGCFTLLGVFVSFRQQSGNDRRHWS